MIGEILHQWSHIFLESALWLLVGFGLSGVSKVLIDSEKWLGRALGRKGLAGAAVAAVVGAPLPLCSCSVLPAAIGLRRQGASRGATSSFLVSVPETDIVSVMITWALLGPAMAIARPVAAVVTALTTGWAVETLAPDGEGESRPAEEPASCCGGDAKPVEAAESCCEGGSCSTEVQAVADPAWKRALHYGYIKFLDDISGPLLLGILLAGILAAVAEGLNLDSLMGSAWTGYLVALLIGIPTYVCATASTPMAIGFLAAGMSPGAVLVFLLAGPATNVASFVVLGREFGRRGLVVYIAAIALVSLVFGLVFDLGFRQDVQAVVQAPEMEHGVSWVKLLSAAVLGALLLASIWRKRRSVSRFLRV